MVYIHSPLQGRKHINVVFLLGKMGMLRLTPGEQEIQSLPALDELVHTVRTQKPDMPVIGELLQGVISKAKSVGLNGMYTELQFLQESMLNVALGMNQEHVTSALLDIQEAYAVPNRERKSSIL